VFIINLVKRFDLFLRSGITDVYMLF